MQTEQEFIIEQTQNEERNKFDMGGRQNQLAPKESPFASFTEKRKIPYKDYFQLEMEKKTRQDELRFAYRELREREREKERVIVRRVIRTAVMPAPWAEFVDHKSPYLYFLENRNNKEKAIWESKIKYNPDIFKSYSNEKGMDLLEGRKKKSKEQENEKKEQQQRKA